MPPRPETRVDPTEPRGPAYTRQQFNEFYGPQEGGRKWNQAGGGGQVQQAPRPRPGGRPQSEYYVGQQVRALGRLEGNHNQVVQQGAVGVVTAVPGQSRGVQFEHGAVAEVRISGVTFDAQPDMIAPVVRGGGQQAAPRQQQYAPPSPQYGGGKGGARAGGKGPAPRAPAPRAPPQQPATRRMDPTDPGSRKTYTIAQFTEYHGQQEGARLWAKAGKLLKTAEQAAGPRAMQPQRRPPAPQQSQQQQQQQTKRPDPSQPESKKQYTKEQFIAYYGDLGAKMWIKAGKALKKQQAAQQPASWGGGGKGQQGGGKGAGRAAPRQPPPQPVSSERRPDPTTESKKTYTKQQFLEYYGEEGKKLWIKAGRMLKRGAEQAAPQRGGGGRSRQGQPMQQQGRAGGAAAEEKRADPTDTSARPRKYTRAEFIEFYGKQVGPKVWKKAGAGMGQQQQQQQQPRQGGAPAKATRMRAAPEPEEKRLDPTDPNGRKKYSRDEFLNFYGDEAGRKLWKKAGKAIKAQREAPPPQQQQGGRGRAPKASVRQQEERRRDPTDGGKKQYTKKEFIDYYGQKQGTALWKKAGKSQ